MYIFHFFFFFTAICITGVSLLTCGLVQAYMNRALADYHSHTILSHTEITLFELNQSDDGSYPEIMTNSMQKWETLTTLDKGTKEIFNWHDVTWLTSVWILTKTLLTSDWILTKTGPTSDWQSDNSLTSDWHLTDSDIWLGSSCQWHQTDSDICLTVTTDWQ